MITHCGELLHHMAASSDVELTDSHMIASGVTGIIKDKFDNQEYVIIIMPRRSYDKQEGTSPNVP